jgi:hypothetical protein
MEERDWLYLLPDGRTAINKKEVCEIMGLSSGYFRRLVKEQVIKKTNRSTNANPKGDAIEKTKGLEPKN